MSVVISNNFKKKFLQGSVKGVDNWKFTPVNSAFKDTYEHDDVKIEHYRSLKDLAAYKNIDYKVNGKYIDYVWSKVLDDDDFSNKPMFITKGLSKRFKGTGVQGNWNQFKRSNYWPQFSANSANLESYIYGKQDGFYVIRSKDELSWFADRVNEEHGNNEIIGVLGDAIEGVIDNTIGISEDRPFEGILDGNGFTLKNMTLQCNQTDNGIVGVLGEKGIVRNFRLASDAGNSFTMTCEKQINLKYLTTDARDINCGFLVGRNYGTVENIDAKHFGAFNLSAFVPQVYSVTNKSDDYDDFYAVRSKWSSNEDNFFFLNSWCINSPGNICPYVGYFAEGIYAERALMKHSKAKTPNGGYYWYSDVAEIPVLRNSLNDGDINHEVYSNWLPSWVWGNDNNSFPFNSNASIPVRTKSFEFADKGDSSHKSGVECIAYNFTVFYDADGNCYNSAAFLNKRFADKGEMMPFFAGMEILKLNQPSAKALFCKDYDTNHDDQDDAGTDVWGRVIGDVTLKESDKLVFVSGDTEWVVHGTPKYINGMGQLVEFPLRKNQSGYSVMNRAEIVEFLEKPGVIPLGTRYSGLTPSSDSRFLYNTPGQLEGTYKSDMIGWYVFSKEAYSGQTETTAIATLNYSDANSSKVSRILELLQKFDKIYSDAKLGAFVNYEDQIAEGLAATFKDFENDIPSWFTTDESTEGSFWHMDKSNANDIKIMTLLQKVKMYGYDSNDDLLDLKEALATKLNEIYGSNVFSQFTLEFWCEGASISRGNENNAKSNYEFFWRGCNFPISDFTLSSSDDNKLYYSFVSDTADKYAGTVHKFGTYFHHLGFGTTNSKEYVFNNNGDSNNDSKISAKIANSMKLHVEDPAKFYNNYVWLCDWPDNYQWDHFALIGEYPGNVEQHGDEGKILEFFMGSDYQPLLMACPATVNEESGTEGRGKFSATFVDLFAFRYISPRPLWIQNGGTFRLNQQTLGHTLVLDPSGYLGVENGTLPYYKALVRAPEYYEIDANGFFTTDVNASLAGVRRDSFTNYYNEDNAIINYNNNIQMRSLSGIDGSNSTDWDYLKYYLVGEGESEHFDERRWPIYELGTSRNGDQDDTSNFGHYKFNISNSLLNKSVRMHDIERAAYYVSPLVGSNYGVISNVELEVSAQNPTNFVGFIGGLAGKQERGVVKECTVDMYDNFTYAGADSRKYWSVKYKTQPFFPPKIADEIMPLASKNISEDSISKEVLNVLFADEWRDKTDDVKKYTTDDVNIYYLKPIFNVGGLFGKIVPSYSHSYIGDFKTFNGGIKGCKIYDVNVNYMHTGNARLTEIGNGKAKNYNQLFNGEDLHNNYGTIAGLIELETNNCGGGVRKTTGNRLGISISNCSIKGVISIPNDIGSVNEGMLPFGRFHYIPNEINTVPATNMSPRDKANTWTGPTQYQTWTLDYPIITNQSKNDKMHHNIFNTNHHFGGLINQSPNSIVGSDVEITEQLDGTFGYDRIQGQDELGNSIMKLSHWQTETGLTTFMRDTLQHIIETSDNSCNVSATTRTNIGLVMNESQFDFTVKLNFTPAFDVLTDDLYPGVKRVNPSFGSYINYSRTGLPETINYMGPTKVFDASTTVTNDRLFEKAKRLTAKAPFKSRLKNLPMFRDTEKLKDKYFYYTYEEHTGSTIAPFTQTVTFTTATSGNSVPVMGYTFKDSHAFSADGFNYQNNYIHLGESISNMQIRENLTKTGTFTTRGVSSNNGFGGILVTDSSDDIVMYIDNTDNYELNGNSWNYETPSAKRFDGNCGVILEVK